MKQSELNADVRMSALMRGLGYLALIDLFLLPYVGFLVMPYTLVVVVAWAVCRMEVTFDAEIWLFLIVAGGVVLSTFLSPLTRPDLPMENVKRAGQLLTTFSYYFFFRSLARDSRFRPTRLLVVFLTITAAWSLWFLASPEGATNLIMRFYPLTRITGPGNITMSRFAYIYMDANSSAYITLMLAFYLAQFGCLKRFGRATVILLAIPGVIASGSRGALLSSFLVVGIMVFRNGHRVLIKAIRFAPAMLILLIGAVFGFRYWSENHPATTMVLVDTVNSAQNRLIGRDEQTLSEVLLVGEESAGASRMTTYRWVVSNLWPLPLGRGYEAVKGTFRPHSDILRMVYSYGFIAAAAIIWFFFRDVQRKYFIVPALITFTFNSLIDEQKLLATFLVLLALARVQTRNRHSHRAAHAIPVRRQSAPSLSGLEPRST